MKINFANYDLENFLMKDVIFCGIDAVLITPNHIGTKFTQKNKIFRSSIWSKDGVLLSAGLKKFVNFGENPENFPAPASLNGCKIIDKIDGSLCIVDNINNIVSMRTRGTSNFSTLENCQDFDYCLSKYPKIKDWLSNHQNYSLLLEITTPNLKIVIDYGNEPDFWLIGAVNKDDYSLMTQIDLDELSKELGIKRPEYYVFSSMDNLMDSIKNIIGKEGCCLYSKGDSEIHKIKGEHYLKLHHMKSELASLEKVLDVWISKGYPSYTDFYNYIATTFDYEIAEQIRGNLSNICDGYKEALCIVQHMKKFVEPLRSLPRKDAALKIIQAYGETNRKSFCFNLLDGKELDGESIKKLIFQVLKK